jgi:uridine kinase
VSSRGTDLATLSGSNSARLASAEMADALTLVRPVEWPQRPPLVIGFGGGSGSGKTTIARAVVEGIGPESVEVIQHDAYYRHHDLSLEQRAQLNYDHPDSLETDLLIRHLGELCAGRAAQRPVYDFAIYDRTGETVLVEPKPVIIVEGILVLAEPELREVLHLKVYVDTEADLRVLRRLKRDLEERGRSFESAYDRYIATVKPMHVQFVEPSRSFADVVIRGVDNRRAVESLVSMIRGAMGTE